MSKSILDAEFSASVKAACRMQNRYRTLIVIGPPRSGKSTLLKRFCEDSGWHYVDYTLDDGHFNAISDVERYSPVDFKDHILFVMHDFAQSLTDNPQRGVVVDEIESILSTWQTDMQNVLFNQISSLTRQPCGLIIATRLRLQPAQLRPYVKNQNQIFNISGV